MLTLPLSANKSCSEALLIFTLFKFRKTFSKQTFNEKRTLLTIEIILSSQCDHSLGSLSELIESDIKVK